MSWIQGKGFCFTGKGMLNGQLIVRGVLESYIKRNGGYIVSKPSSSDHILVASLTDSVKARAAVNCGARVVDYNEFWQICGIRSDFDLSQPPSPGSEQQIRQQDAKKSVAEKREERRRAAEAMAEAEQSIEGWGSF